MRPLVLTLLCWLCALFPVRASAPPGDQIIRLPFYSTEVALNFHPQAISRRLASHEPGEIKHFLWSLEQGRLQALLHGLQTSKALLRLNDWLFLELCHQALKESYPHLTSSEQQIALCWVFARSGFDARLIYDEQEVEMIVLCPEKVYNAASVFIQPGRPGYLIPSSVGGPQKRENMLFYLDYAPNPRGRALSFSFNGWPILPSDTVVHALTFRYERQEYGLQIKVPTSLRELLFDYPVVESEMYWQTPMSPYLRDQLVAQLAPIMDGRSPADAIRLLLAFTRQAFPYETDEVAYGFEKPFFAEELFLHPYSDCEDRVALFYNLVRELLGLPMLVLEMPDHLTTAVAFDGGDGRFLRHKGRIYWICDPTGPLSESGRTPLAPEYESDEYRLLDSYL